MSQHRVRPLERDSSWAAALAAGLLVSLAPAVAPAADAPGLVQEKPAEGRYVKTDRGYMVPYSQKIPGTDVTFEMVPIPGGKFTMGSPKSEAGRQENEGPQFEVVVEPFWMGKYEVTWSEYKKFMALYDAFKDFGSLRVTLNTPAEKSIDNGRRKKALLEALENEKYKELKERLTGEPNKADAITAPTKLYEPSFTFEFGDDPRQPAVTMTQYAAKHYTKWLSALTGEFYRLPTEAEWEYAARAGTQTAYFFGDDPSKLGEYAWYYENADYTIHLIGQKKPSPWGLYDIYGNAAEWVLDELASYEKYAGKTVAARDCVAWPTKPYPRVVRGGHWDSDPEELRSAARLGSDDPNWKSYDPNIPLSPWWFTNDPARGVSFRLLRPLAAPTPEEKKKAWEEFSQPVLDDVANRLQEGRGAQAPVDADLPRAIKQLKEVKEQIHP
jgi:formylglycine-generating enzyme required for sulfatase activity